MESVPARGAPRVIRASLAVDDGATSPREICLVGPQHVTDPSTSSNSNARGERPLGHGRTQKSRSSLALLTAPESGHEARRGDPPELELDAHAKEPGYVRCLAVDPRADRLGDLTEWFHS